MVNTRLEAAIQGIGDGARLEQLASDLLSRGGYRVEPTGTRGPDGGRDALLYQDNEKGILHCSVAQSWEKKAKEDAEKANNRSEDFDFFIFVTTQNPAGIKRDRVEEELREEYEWRIHILDFEHLRNQLMGDSENHDLAREHLSINPNLAFEDAQMKADEFYEQCLERLRDRESHYGTIRDRDEVIPGASTTNEPIVRDDPPILAVHMIPATTFGGNHDRLGSELPDPPTFGGGRQSDQFGDFVISGSSDGLYNDEPFTYYSCFHEDGWTEAVMTHYCIAGTEEPMLSTCNDVYIVDFIQNALEWYSNVGIYPPFYTYLTLLDAAEYTMYVPFEIGGPGNQRKVGTDEFRFGQITIETSDADIPNLLRKPLYRLWNRTGWSTGSLHYTEYEDEETGEVNYEWEPREKCL